MRHHNSLEQRLQALEATRQQTAQYGFSLADWREWNSTGQRDKITECLSPESRVRLEQCTAIVAMFEATE